MKGTKKNKEKEAIKGKDETMKERTKKLIN
jgi:hypothetical protein